MSGIQEKYIAVHQIASIAAGTDDILYFPLPTGTWKLTAASILPSTTSAADATDYTTIDLRNGDTNLCVTALTTASTALTEGTARAFTLVNAYVEFVGGTNYLCLNKADAGGGAVMDVTLIAEFEKIRA